MSSPVFWRACRVHVAYSDIIETYSTEDNATTIRNLRALAALADVVRSANDVVRSAKEEVLVLAADEGAGEPPFFSVSALWRGRGRERR